MVSYLLDRMQLLMVWHLGSVGSNSHNGGCASCTQKGLDMHTLPQDMKQLLDMYEDKKQARKEFITGCVVAVTVVLIFSL